MRSRHVLQIPRNPERLGDAVGFVVVAASTEPSREAGDGDLVVPAEQADEFAASPAIRDGHAGRTLTRRLCRSVTMSP